MKILVYPGLMETGGSQLNALQLAHGVAQRGHEVILFGPDGVLLAAVERLGLEYIFAPREHRWPSPRNMRALRRLVEKRHVDVVHGYEWGPALDLAFGPHASLGTPLVTTILSMEVPGFLPAHSPLIVGTRELAESERVRRSNVYLMEPPVDTGENAPTTDRSAARARFSLDDRDVVLAVVCRLTHDLGKLDGVLEAAEVVGRRGRDLPLRLLVVGDGAGLPAIRDRAEIMNRRLGRPAVDVVGELLDPRDAYSAADIVLGMGSSALKGMAFGKPLIVQGERGFWELLDEHTLPRFLQHGWWGVGEGDGEARLDEALMALLSRRSEWAGLGALGRQIVVRGYSLEHAVDMQVGLYRHAIEQPPTRARARTALARSACEVAKYKAYMAAHRVAGLRRAGHAGPAEANA